jgi:hypothetical protein
MPTFIGPAGAGSIKRHTPGIFEYVTGRWPNLYRPPSDSTSVVVRNGYLYRTPSWQETGEPLVTAGAQDFQVWPDDSVEPFKNDWTPGAEYDDDDTEV